jgi:hypothetical protein
MKNIIISLASLFAALNISFADVELAPAITVGGFIDMSYSDGEGESTLGIDQVEVEFSIDNGSAVSALINVQYEEDESETNIEEAYVTYEVDPSSSFTFGRFESALFFDDSEPTGLYQVSTAYAVGSIDPVQEIYDLRDQGIRYNYNTLDSAFSLSLVDNGDYSIELAYEKQFTDQWSGFLGGRFYKPEADGVDDGNIWNAYVTYAMNQWLFAAEYISYDAPTFGAFPDVEGLSIDDAEGDLYQLMANYAYSDANSVTFRYSKMDVALTDSEDTSMDSEGDKWTVAHNAALADNLAMVAEFSRVDLEAADDADEFAVELLYTF